MESTLHISIEIPLTPLYCSRNLRFPLLHLDQNFLLVNKQNGPNSSSNQINKTLHKKIQYNFQLQLIILQSELTVTELMWWQLQLNVGNLKTYKSTIRLATSKFDRVSDKIDSNMNQILHQLGPVLTPLPKETTDIGKSTCLTIKKCI